MFILVCSDFCWSSSGIFGKCFSITLRTESLHTGGLFEKKKNKKKKKGGEETSKKSEESEGKG